MPKLDTLIGIVYFGYLGFTVVLGVAGELLGMPALCQVAVKLALIFLSTLGVLLVVGVGLALCWCAWATLLYARRVARDRMH
jgi:hypothetical protein